MSGDDLYVGGDFSTAGGSPVRNIAKWNGKQWSALGVGVDNEVTALAAAGASVYVNGGDLISDHKMDGDCVLKWDGHEWRQLGAQFNNKIETLAAAGDDVYAGGIFSQVGEATTKSIAKWDGVVWHALGEGVRGLVRGLAVSGRDVYVGGNINYAGQVRTSGIAKWDGTRWSALGQGIKGDVYTLAVSGRTVYAGGDIDSAGQVGVDGVARWNGIEWSALNTNNMHTRTQEPTIRITGYEISAMAVSGKNVYVSGDFSVESGHPAIELVKWNGKRWSELASGSFEDPIMSLAVSANKVYAAGSFSQVGLVAADHFAKWNGKYWSALGPGPRSRFYTLAASETALYVGAEYFAADGVTYRECNCVVRWDGHKWDQLGARFSGAVMVRNRQGQSSMPEFKGNIEALVVSGSDVYAVGNFTKIGELTVNHVAKWDGTAWSALGAGISGLGNALAVSGSEVYVASADFSGKINTYHVNKWNGATWSVMGANFTGLITTLAVSGNKVYAGGLFEKVGDFPANHIARWDGSAWSALGQGTDRWVETIAVSGKDVYIGGTFQRAGGVEANNVAHWNGTAWRPMGTGLNDWVRTLVLGPDGKVYVAGNFTTVGDGSKVSAYFAIYDPR